MSTNTTVGTVAHCFSDNLLLLACSATIVTALILTHAEAAVVEICHEVELELTVINLVLNVAP